MPVPRCAITLLFCCSACGGEAANDAPPAPSTPTFVTSPPPPLEQVTETVSEPVLEQVIEPVLETATQDHPAACGNLGPFDPVPLTPESVACSSNGDCRIRDASCCPMCKPENIIAIRAGAEPFWECCVPLPVCPHWCEPYEPGVHAACIEGRCTLVSGPWPTSAPRK